MSLTKQILEERYVIYGIATDALVRVGTIKTCKVHGDRFVADESTLEAAYKLANSWISRGYVKCDRRELTDAIKEVLEMTPEECLSCENVMYDDD